MSSPASIGKHPVHPMLVAFPIGLWVFALICDVVRWTVIQHPEARMRLTDALPAGLC
jgi:uncharacterized membrane protein